MIHKFEFDGTKIVLDVNSGAVHVMDEPAWEMVDDFYVLVREDMLSKYRHRYSEELIGEVLQEMTNLYSEGLLYSEDKFSGPDDVSNDTPVVKSLCLNISHDCNLRCRYCFAGSGHFGGQRALMPLETGTRALDFLLEMSAGRRHCEVDFFGGEPLMNMAVVRELVSYGRSRAAQLGKEIKFTLTTNAVLLDRETADFLNNENISVVLSLDGKPETNDTMRKTVNGGGSYSIIEPKISSFIKGRNNENYIVRGTYTRHNTGFCGDVLHLADLGYRYVSVEPVVGMPWNEWSIREADLPAICREYELLCREYLNRMQEGRPFEFFHFNLDLNNGPCLPKRISGCGAGYEYMAVTPEGDLYPCHQFVGREQYRLGSVWDGITGRQVVDGFRQAHVYNKAKCRDCWAKFHCGGGCHANAQLVSGSVMEPYHIGCEIEKKRLECAIYIQVLRAGNTEE
ncbi:MAG: thioether cross-link-forming SCIFF peptide maturase [Firmicutes bacterium HGW-Firmicutes-14]|nr:MAG: thioether cross-link-forming SCIFF peptide maturase [Firmicutes bacterium HGW-Firmicutes-14]